MKFRILLIAAVLTLPFIAFGTSTTFSRTLKLGMKGEDVRALQQFLNADIETRVAWSGAGSRGSETDYFGPATKRALTKFQEKHRAEILTQLGLAQGTGVLGEKTRARIVALQNTRALQTVSTTSTATKQKVSTRKEPVQVVATVATTTIPQPIPWTPDMVVPEGVNPNSINLEYALSEIKKVGKRQGMSDAQLSTLEKIIREKTETTTDLTKEFFKKANIKTYGTVSSIYDISKTDGFFGRIFTMLGIVKIANALGSPWGGKVITAWPCTCPPDIWLLTITPLPPTYAAVLTYIGGTQLFASYIPTPHTGQSFLGFYEPIIQMCYEYVGTACTVVPSEGFISPEVGSSI